MESKVGACVTVAKGGVGESGVSSLLIHTVGGAIPKLMVLRNVDSSLCANTGAVAMIVVNGVPAASADITTKGSSLQTEARPDAHVAAIIHTVPLFNGMVCTRLGELTAHLDECDFVTACSGGERTGGVVSTCDVVTRDWYAWNNTMPPKPDDFHVVGEVQVPNPGVDVFLVPRVPQGINPRILLLDLILIQRPGVWPQIVVWKRASYEKVNADYERVQIFCGTNVIADVPVDIVT